MINVPQDTQFFKSGAGTQILGLGVKPLPSKPEDLTGDNQTHLRAWWALKLTVVPASEGSNRGLPDQAASKTSHMGKFWF